VPISNLEIGFYLQFNYQLASFASTVKNTIFTIKRFKNISCANHNTIYKIMACTVVQLWWWFNLRVVKIMGPAATDSRNKLTFLIGFLYEFTQRWGPLIVLKYALKRTKRVFRILKTYFVYGWHCSNSSFARTRYWNCNPNWRIAAIQMKKKE
jgi:hypothetical protein